MSFWWLSFADEDGFLGGLVIEAEGFIEAVRASHQKGLNPGGEVRGCRIPPTTVEGLHPYVPDKLYSKADIEAIDTAERF